METLLTEVKAEVSLMNQEGNFFYKKFVPLSTSLPEILQFFSAFTMEESECIGINISFPNIDWFNSIMIWYDKELPAINYSFSNQGNKNEIKNPSDKIGIENLGEEEINDLIATKLYHEVWDRGEKIMKVFVSDDLFVEWGGSKVSYLMKDQTELLINFDYCGFLTFMIIHNINQSEKFNALTLEDLRDKSLQMSKIVIEIFDSVASEFSS